MDPLYLRCRAGAELLPPEYCKLAQLDASVEGANDDAHPICWVVIIVKYRGRAVALVRPSCVEFHGRVMALEADHPHRRWAFCLSLFAFDVVDGLIPGPYSDFRAGVFARQALIPDDEFLELATLDDAVLAEYFNVPLPEIEEKRADVQAAASF